MNEATLLRMLRMYPKVRGPDFHRPPTRDSKGNIENVTGIYKRHPLSKEQRAEVEKTLASNAAGDALERAENSNSTDVSGQADERAKLVEPADFFRVFDAWVDSKYPCDRRSATQIKVAFRKQHRSTVAHLCLEDIEDIAQAMR